MYNKLLSILIHHPKAWPKLVLRNKFGQEIAFGLNRITNEIWVTNNKLKSNGKVCYAKIEFIPTRKPIAQYFRSCTRNTQIGIRYLLGLYLESPSKYAKKFGDTNHKCMYCERKLSHPESILHGYGKICAANYSLPWGYSINQAKKAIKTSIAIKNKNSLPHLPVQLEMDI